MTSVPVWRFFPLLCFLWITLVETDATALQPPHINKQAAADTMYIKRRDVITLSCEASGNPKPSYKWIHNGRDLNMTKYIQQTPGHGTIIITIYGEQQDGYYQCFATNKFGTSVSNVVRMQWAFLDPIDKKVSQTTMIAPGKSILFHDTLPRSVPYGELQWLRISQNGTEEDVTDLFPANEVTFTNEGHLIFRSLSKKHSNVGSPYRLAVTNTVLSKRVLGTEFTLQVEGPEAVLEEPVIWMYTSHYTVFGLQGETVTLRCIYAGNPIPVIKWKRKTGELPSKHELSEDASALTIPNFQESDSTSDYICEASNGVSSNDLFKSFTVIYQARPSWVLAPASKTLLEGDAAMFWCSAYGVPAPDHVWYINGVKLQDVQDSRIYKNARVSITESRTNGHELTIANVTAADNMNIQCNATNRHGYVFSDVYLAVQTSQTSGADVWTTFSRDLYIMMAFILWCVI